MSGPDERISPAGHEVPAAGGRQGDDDGFPAPRRTARAHETAAGGEPPAAHGGTTPAERAADADVDVAAGGPAGPVTATGSPAAGDGPVVVSPAAYRRLMSGLPGYAVAMLCCLAIAGLVLLITPRRNQNAVLRVDYGGDLAGLVVVAPYPVWAPEGLPAGWYPTSSRLTGTTGGPLAWHLGFYTPGKQYAAVEQSDERPGDRGGFVDRMTSQGRPDGTVIVAGAPWDRTFRKDKDQRSLVRRLPGVTLVVTGTASYDELAVLAGSLRRQPKPSPRASVTGP